MSALESHYPNCHHGLHVQHREIHKTCVLSLQGVLPESFPALSSITDLSCYLPCRESHVHVKPMEITLPCAACASSPWSALHVYLKGVLGRLRLMPFINPSLCRIFTLLPLITVYKGHLQYKGGLCLVKPVLSGASHP